LFYRKELLIQDIVLIVSNSVDIQSSYVLVAKRGLTAPENVKSRTGQAKATDSVTSNGADTTNVEKRTSTGRSSPFPTKDSASEPRN